MKQGIRNPVLRFLAYSHLWLALGAAAQVYWLGDLFFTPSLRLAAFAGFGTLAAYGTMRLLRLDEPSPDSSDQSRWMGEGRTVMQVIVAVSIVMSVWSVWPLWDSIRQALLFPVVASLLYVLPRKPFGGRLLGLRRLPFLKSVIVAVVWAAVTVSLPAAHQEAHEVSVVPWLFFVQCCFILSLMIPFDIRDAQHDPAFFRTLPQLIGERGARWVAVALGLLPVTMFAMLIFIRHASGDGVEPTLLLPMIGYMVSAIVVGSAHPRRSPFYFLLLVDGMIVLIPLLAWVGSLM